MSVSRAILGRGPAIVSYNGITLFTRDDIVPRHAPVWNPVVTSMYGEVDKSKRDLAIRIPLRLWGSWENLAVLFPASVMNPVIGLSVYGTVDTPLTILARNGDQITYTNAQITKLGDLYLGVDSELWAADVEFTALLKNAANPEDAGAYYTTATGQAYADNAFSKQNFKRVRWTGVWGNKVGFGSLAAQKGFNIAWTLDLRPIVVDGYGTVDMTLGNFIGMVRCIPIGPTLQQIETNAYATGTPHGALLSTNANGNDFVMTGGGSSVTLKNAGLMEHGYAFGVEPLRIGEVSWGTTRGFVAGVPSAVGAVTQ